MPTPTLLRTERVGRMKNVENYLQLTVRTTVGNVVNKTVHMLNLRLGVLSL